MNNEDKKRISELEQHTLTALESTDANSDAVFMLSARIEALEHVIRAFIAKDPEPDALLAYLQSDADFSGILAAASPLHNFPEYRDLEREAVMKWQRLLQDLCE